VIAGLDLHVFGDALQFVFDERRLILEKTWEHLLLSGAALAIATAIALPLGVWLGHLHRGSFLAVNVANLGRALPSLAVIAVGFVFLGVGFWSVALALVVLAVPPILTNTYVAVDGVQTDAVEAARGMGMTRRQIVTRVELPLALPLIFAGIRTATVFVVATATTVLSALLGTLMGYSLARFNTGGPHLSFWVLSQRFLPPIAIVLPIFLLYRGLGLYDSRIGLILIYTVITLPLSVWMMYAYFRQLPKEMEEAALVDGCSRFGAFWRIALPLSVPGIIVAAVAVLSSVVALLEGRANEAETLLYLAAGLGVVTLFVVLISARRVAGGMEA